MMKRLLLPCVLGLSFPLMGGELELRENDDVIRVSLRGKPVLEYLKTEKPVPEGMADAYRRSGYIHPVFSPGGQEVTGDFAPDHPHQHALFMAWTSSVFDGKKIDFWNLAKEQGRVEHREVTAKEEKDDRVSFSVKHAYVAGKGDQRKDILHETWTVTVHETPEEYFLFDVESVQECATDKPLTLPKHKYGGMALRGNTEWVKEKDDRSINPGDLRFLTSEGKDRWESNHTNPNWVAMTGQIDGKEATIAVMGHPKNFRAPQSVRIHPEKPYFCFAPMVDGEFKIEPGKKYVSRYRYLVTSTAADPELIEKHWRQYSAEAE